MSSSCASFGIPALYVMALWLHPSDGEDWVVPIAPAPAGLQAERFYRVEDFCARLAGPAKSVKQQAPVESRAPTRKGSPRAAKRRTPR